MAANSDTLVNRSIVTNIAIHNAMMNKRPATGDLSPKNAADHKMFNISCTPNTVSPVFTAGISTLLRQTRNKDIPMSTYKVIHTGPNNQLGGLKAGFLSAAYQVGTAGAVKTEPMIPAS